LNFKSLPIATQIACLQKNLNVNGKRKATKDLDVEKQTLMGKLNTYAKLFIIHIQLLNIFFFFNQLIIVINQRPLLVLLGH
jgi:hypothetical protein